MGLSRIRWYWNFWDEGPLSHHTPPVRVECHAKEGRLQLRPFRTQSLDPSVTVSYSFLTQLVQDPSHVRGTLTSPQSQVEIQTTRGRHGP